MRIVARWFGDSDVYARLARVLEYSIRKNVPNATCDVVHVSADPIKRYDAFVEKVRAWRKVAARAQTGERIAFLDVDMLVLAPLDDAFSDAWDVAVTVRHARDRINSGAVYVTISDYSRAFMAEWLRRTEALAGGRYGDQDALIAQCDAGGKERQWPVRELPCAIWNCEQSSWNALPTAKVVHVKSDARKRLFYDPAYRMPSPNAMGVVRMWRKYERDATR